MLTLSKRDGKQNSVSIPSLGTNQQYCNTGFTHCLGALLGSSVLNHLLHRCSVGNVPLKDNTNSYFKLLLGQCCMTAFSSQKHHDLPNVHSLDTKNVVRVNTCFIFPFLLFFPRNLESPGRKCSQRMIGNYQITLRSKIYLCALIKNCKSITVESTYKEKCCASLVHS